MAACGQSCFRPVGQRLVFTDVGDGEFLRLDINVSADSRNVDAKLAIRNFGTSLAQLKGFVLVESWC